MLFLKEESQLNKILDFIYFFFNLDENKTNPENWSELLRITEFACDKRNTYFHFTSSSP